MAFAGNGHAGVIRLHKPRMSKVRVKQTFTVTRTIEMEVAADDPDQAALLVSEGAVDVPAFDDPKWAEKWDLQRETSEGVE